MTAVKQLVFAIALCLLSLSPVAQNKYALLVGINDYYEVKGGAKSEISLHGPVNDANSIRSLLISKFGFKSAHIDTIYNGNATRDNIIAALKKKLAQCRPGDAMLFYYSGHGVYMYNSDEIKDTVKSGMNQAMLTSDLYNYTDHLKCFLRDFTLKQYFNLFVDKKVVLTALFDCCFSGNLAMAPVGPVVPAQVKSVDLKELFGRLTYNADNPQLLIDSINGITTTIAGCATDSSGMLKDNTDSDGDGVPDCKDKEKFTPKECLPVTADGVGSCSFEYMQQQFQKTQDNYDAAELTNANASPAVATRSVNVGAVLRIAEKDTIARPVDRKNSKFLFISAATDRQEAAEFPDSSGVLHGFFTASILRVFKKYPANSDIHFIFQKVVDDMAGYHRPQNPIKRSDPGREKGNLVGVKL